MRTQTTSALTPFLSTLPLLLLLCVGDGVESARALRRASVADQPTKVDDRKWDWTTGIKADPIIHSITPNHGTDAGGFHVALAGRHLGFLSRDIDAVYILSGLTKLECTNVEVVVPWELMTCMMPPCPHCGRVDIVVLADEARSERIPFTYTNNCQGPTADGSLPILPPPFSQAENCTVCLQLVDLVIANSPDHVNYQAVRESFSFACHTLHFKNFTSPVLATPGCTTDLTIACEILVYSLGETMLDILWDAWDTYYLYGTLSDHVCRYAGRCK